MLSTRASMVSAQWNYNFVVKIMMLNSGAIGNLCPSNNIVLAWYDDVITRIVFKWA